MTAGPLHGKPKWLLVSFIGKGLKSDFIPFTVKTQFKACLGKLCASLLMQRTWLDLQPELDI